jgi:hypothetical protein
VLRQEASHHHFSVIVGARVLAITTVEFVRHPLRKRSLVRFDGRDFLWVVRHVIRKSFSELGSKRFATLDAFGDETKSSSLQAGISRRHHDGS